MASASCHGFQACRFYVAPMVSTLAPTSDDRPETHEMTAQSDIVSLCAWDGREESISIAQVHPRIRVCMYLSVSRRALCERTPRRVKHTWTPQPRGQRCPFDARKPRRRDIVQVKPHSTRLDSCDSLRPSRETFTSTLTLSSHVVQSGGEAGFLVAHAQASTICTTC